MFGEEIDLALELVYADHTEEADAPGLWQLQDLTFIRPTAPRTTAPRTTAQAATP